VADAIAIPNMPTHSLNDCQGMSLLIAMINGGLKSKWRTNRGVIPFERGNA
jgi:hypothetical protein